MKQYRKNLRPNYVSGFRKHIKEAIRLNRKRRIIYANATAGKSRKLSTNLILLERLVLPIALYFDLKGKKYNQQGIGVVRDDFVAMEVHPAKTKPIYRNELSSEIYNEVAYQKTKLLKQISASSTLDQIVISASQFIALIEKLELKYGVHLAMLKHLVESLWLIASNGIKYSQKTNGRTEPISWQLIRIHAFAMRFALFFDKEANKFHQEGIGILVNDLPKINVEQNI